MTTIMRDQNQCLREWSVVVAFYIISNCFYCLIDVTNAFNLETRLPIIKYGPNEHGYFGYAVAAHTVGEYNMPNNTKW